MLVEFFDFLGATAFLWGPVVLAMVFWHVWIEYNQRDFISKLEWITLEIKVPRDVLKTPLAMEIVLTALHQHSKGNWYQRWWQGRVTHWFSLEMASIEGNIYFFIHAIKNYRDLIETEIYAQYPQAEVNLVDDYARYMERYVRSNEWSMLGTEYELVKQDEYPIKTYVDYGLDKAAEEEEKIDPITSVLEFLGTIRKGEQAWVQILIKKHESKMKKEKGALRAVSVKHVDEVKKLIEKDFLKKRDQDDNPLKLTKREQYVLEAIERNAGKPLFDTGIRTIYIAQKEVFRVRISSVLSLFRAFGAPELNGFKPKNTTTTDLPWDDTFNTIIEKRKEDMFKAYINRTYFYYPPKYGCKPFVKSTEELATLYHFPGRVSETPTFSRLEVKKSEPPLNLPI